MQDATEFTYQQPNQKPQFYEGRGQKKGHYWLERIQV
jgi:hypothetical protein